MSQNIGDEFSSDEVTVYKEEGEVEVGQVAGENFGLDKAELIKEAEQVTTKPADATLKKDTLSNAPHDRTTPAVHRQFNNFSGSIFDGNGALSPSAAGLFSASNPYAALISASRFAGALSPVTLSLLAAASNSQPATSPGPLSADQVSALMAAGVASPPALAAVIAARSSPALAALQVAAALHPYSVNRSNAGSTTPSVTPGVASSGDQFGAMVAAAGLQQLAALAAAQSPPVWPGVTNSNSAAASNWLYAAGHPGGLPSAPVGGGIGSPALAACASPSSSLLARLSPALSTLSCLAAAANAPPAAHHHPASFLLNAATAAAAQHNVPSPSSAASSVSNHYAPQSNTSTTNDSTANSAVEAMLRAAMIQQQQQNQQQQQQLSNMLDMAQQIAMANAAASGNSPTVPLTPRAKVPLPTPTSRPRPPGMPIDLQQSSPLALSNSLKRPHGLAHQTTRPGMDPQQSPMMPLGPQQPIFPAHQQQSPAHHHHSAFAPAMDPRRQAHMAQQQMMQQEQFPQNVMMGMNHGHHHHQHRSHSPMNPNEPHVKKPLNAFMLFMKEQRAQVIAECTLKESAAINQILGQRWHNLSRDEQARYYDLAKAEKERHQQLYPNWSARENYASHAKRKRRRKIGGGGYGGASGPMGAPGMGPESGLKDSRDSALKKCRARYGIDQMDKWCKPCRRKKKCARYYNLPGADDDNDVPIMEAKVTPSAHQNLIPGLITGLNPANGIGPPALGAMGQYGGGGMPSAAEDDDWGSETGSSVGDSVDDEDDEEQLNAFHLVSESSSSPSTPSPTPAVLGPLSPGGSSSIHSSASHPSHHRPHGGYMPLPLSAMVKLAPSTPVSDPAYAPQVPPQQHPIQLQPCNGLQSQQPQFLSDGNVGPQSISSGGVPSVPGTSSSSASSELPAVQLPSTPPSSTSAPTAPQQHLCSPSSASSGIAFRPLLPAN